MDLFGGKCMTGTNTENTEKLSTAIFVDYECWRFALYNMYGMETDVSGWFQDVKTRGQIDELHIFGDFSKELLKKDTPKLRTITNDIIDCTNPEGEKDYTDFIILDRIYQCAMNNKKIQQYIIFSGDGHFSSVAAFLKNFHDKTVGVYAIKGTLNPQLANSASWCQLISPPEQNFSGEIRLILENLRWVETQGGLIPTFSKTINSVSVRYKISRENITAAMKYLLVKGYLTQEESLTATGAKIRALVPNWDLLIQDKLWDAEK